MNTYKTPEEVAKKAEELSEQRGIKIYPLSFSMDEGKTLIAGFLESPSRLAKMRSIDKAMTAPMQAGSDLLDGFLIKEESDPRILAESPENDPIFFAACMEATKCVEIAQNMNKKK